MTPPTLTREARDWLLENSTSPEMNGRIRRMPLAPADPLDAVRARFQAKTADGEQIRFLFANQYVIVGQIGLGPYASVVSWDTETGDSRGRQGRLVPRWTLRHDEASPHAALIARLNEAYITGINDPDLYKRAADALEKQP